MTVAVDFWRVREVIPATADVLEATPHRRYLSPIRPKQKLEIADAARGKLPRCAWFALQAPC